MDVCHILLGQPWQYDLQAIHRGRENTYEFNWMGQKVKLLPSTSPTDKVSSKNKKEIKKQLFCIQESGRTIDNEDNEVWAFIVKDQVSTPFLQEENEDIKSC